ncbi:MAG TPA: ATP-binding protein, partial [Thermohalobaculum sp.]|nr:ATP-binding protein [Thermohalobaculum sp.]
AVPGPGEAGRAGQGAELLAGLPLPLIVLDRQMRVRFANRAAGEMFGPVPAGEPLSSAVRASALADAVAAVARGGAARAVEFTHMRTREERVLMAHVQPVGERGAEQAADQPAVMVLVEDHTRPARIERMRRDFIANASHELKTPLASLAGFIETLQGPAADDAQALKRFLPIMAVQAERMKRLVEDLTSLSRIEMNEHVRPTGTVDLGALVHETAAGMAPLAEAAGVALELALPGHGPQVTGARDELGQLFANLIDNAIKHGGAPGPVRLAPAPDEPGRRAMVGVAVSDRGPGIAREHIPRLTERFYRVQGSGRAKEGTGLGLSIVKHILNRHRGELAIRARPGQGATFTAWLPRAEPAPEGETESVPESGPESGTESAPESAQGVTEKAGVTRESS